MKTAERQGGFSLIEMLAATVLLAIALAVLLPIFGQSMRVLGQDELHSRMANVARSLFDETMVQPLRSGITEGERDGLEWRLNCHEVQAESGVVLFELQLSLRSGPHEQQFKTARLQSAGLQALP